MNGLLFIVFFLSLGCQTLSLIQIVRRRCYEMGLAFAQLIRFTGVLRKSRLLLDSPVCLDQFLALARLLIGKVDYQLLKVLIWMWPTYTLFKVLAMISSGLRLPVPRSGGFCT